MQVKSKAPTYLYDQENISSLVNVPEMPVFGDLALLGITESELDQQCDDLFEDTPIKFYPRKGNKIDENISFYIIQYDILIPIQHIKGDLYLIGSERKNIKQNVNNDNLMVKVGGGYVKFEDHIQKF